MVDGVRDLTHDHADLNRRVLALSTRLRNSATAGSAVAPALVDLRELLFTHFAREEEGLFPFAAECLPELGDRVQAMAVAHDTICGALSRACHLATNESERALFVAVFERFEEAYADHARAEAELLAELDKKLSRQQREQLGGLVAGL